ncbi:MAG: alpha/beta fold hydrolase [Dehalococcoidia bacterium]|jgi:pimeloyl-ACP methyl ester carboxylesterase
MPLIKAGDIKLHYEMSGEGPPLLLINGYGDHTGHWFCMRPVLDRHFTVLAYDNRGSGRSDKPDLPYTMKMLAGDAATLLDELGISRAHVFGVSMGGMVAQELALGYPRKLNSLVLGCTIPGGVNTVYPEPEVLAFLLDGERSKHLKPAEMAREMWTYTCTAAFRQTHPEVGEEYIKITTMFPAPQHGLQWQGDAIAAHDTWDRLPDINATTLVIAGSEDRLVPPRNSQNLAARIPGARAIILENAGHGFFYEAADKAGKIITDFLLDRS